LAGWYSSAAATSAARFRARGGGGRVGRLHFYRIVDVNRIGARRSPTGGADSAFRSTIMPRRASRITTANRRLLLLMTAGTPTLRSGGIPAERIGLLGHWARPIRITPTIRTPFPRVITVVLAHPGAGQWRNLVQSSSRASPSVRRWRVFLTFDIEIGAMAGKALDERSPLRFQRYIYGRSPEGDYACRKDAGRS